METKALGSQLDLLLAQAQASERKKRSAPNKPKLCAVCRRFARGFGYAPALGCISDIDSPVLAFCSITCMDLAAKEKGMIDPNRFEQAALHYASLQAGQYIESIQKTDLQHYSFEEWCTLIDVIVTGFTDGLRNEQHAASQPKHHELKRHNDLKKHNDLKAAL